jgi:transposase
MSKPIERVEIISGRERRRRYTAEEKVRLVEETTRPGMTVSAVARLHGKRHLSAALRRAALVG